MDLRRLATVATLLGGLAVAAPAKEVPYLSGRVVDETRLLSPGARQQIEGQLAALEAQNGDQVAVLIVDSLDGEPLESYSVKVAQTWHLGQKGKDNGILLFIARRDRKLRLEVGYGLEATLTDLQSREILDDVIAPHFKSGEFDAGVEQGVDAIVKVLNGQPLPKRATHAAPVGAALFGMAIFVIVIGTFSLIALASQGGMSWFLYLFLIPFYAVFPAAFLGPIVGFVLVGLWIICFPLLKRVAVARGYFSPQGHHGALWSAFSSPSSSSGGGGFSSGGFSGGGGSFGGGGASSGW
jgi:uncharacterized protein